MVGVNGYGVDIVPHGGFGFGHEVGGVDFVLAAGCQGGCAQAHGERSRREPSVRISVSVLHCRRDYA